jgi:hypothetical protein
MKNSFFKLLVVLLYFASSLSNSLISQFNTSAVLVVGTDSDISSSVVALDKIGEFLESKGIKTYKFYDEKSDWEAIKKAAKNAHFFVYSGHGSNMGKNGTGGLVIKDMVSNTEIENELVLKKNSVVLFQSVCRGAGSSAGDNGDIGIKKAESRVSDYAEPFLKIGAQIYYANNWQDGCLGFLENMFNGISAQESFKKSTGWWTEVELEKNYVYDHNKKIGIVSQEGSGTVTVTHTENGVKTVEKRPASKNYNIAYVGNPNFKLTQINTSR